MKLKKSIPFFLSLFFISTGFAENIVIENQTSYPIKTPKSKIAVQWASSSKEVQDDNHAIMYGIPANPGSLQMITDSGKINVNLPDKAKYFRVLVWSKGEGEPDLVTNWIEFESNKTYMLKDDHLVPAVLMSGSGC
jgi:hypothetical protein